MCGNSGTSHLMSAQLGGASTLILTSRSHTNTSTAEAREEPPRHRHKHSTHTHRPRQRERQPVTRREKPKKKTNRRKSPTVVVNRFAESYCHGRSRTDTGCQTRSGVRCHDRNAGAAIGRILLGNSGLGEFRRNLQTRTRRTPSRVLTVAHTITWAEPTDPIVLGSLGHGDARDSVVHVVGARKEVASAKLMR